MNGQNGTELLLRNAEIENLKLKAEKDQLHIRLSILGPEDAARAKQIREELRVVGDKMDALQIEMMEHRITLLQRQLPIDRAAVEPLQEAFNLADQENTRAFKARQDAAVALHIAQMKVSCAESNINMYESSIARLRQQLASKGSRAKLASEIATEITDLESRLKSLRVMTPERAINNGSTV